MNVDRRSFLKGAAATGIFATAGSLFGCAPKTESHTQTAETEELTWRTPPNPIAEDQISEVVDTDIVVIGAGTSGCPAALQAVELGAKVVVLQKAEGASTAGNGFAAYNSRISRAAGVEMDPDEVINEWMYRSEYRADRRVLKNWIDYSGEMTDWIEERIEGTDAGPLILFETEYDWDNAFVFPRDVKNYMYQTGHMPSTYDLSDITSILMQLAIEKGADVRYETPAIQLVRENDGRGKVSAVIAKDKEGNYIRINAGTAIILAAGDYGNNEEMREELVPQVAGAQSAYPRTDNTGDGHMMGVWVGAQMDPLPHAATCHYDPPVGIPPCNGGSGFPTLAVNLNGERFCNEDCEYSHFYAQDLEQPEGLRFQIWDANYDTYLSEGKFGLNGCERWWGDEQRANWKKYIEDGDFLQGDTFEELAENMGVPAENLVKTVKRYNELVAKGVDEDFGKHPDYMQVAFETPPFYAVRRKAALLVTHGGLTVNDRLQVLDENNEAIEGLYAAGCNSGSWFGGMIHPMIVGGMGAGRAMTTGYLAPRYALGVIDSYWETV